MIGEAMIRQIEDMRGFHPPHSRTRIASHPPALCCTAPYNHIGIVVIVHRTILPTLFKQGGYYVAPHNGVSDMLHRTNVAPHHIAHVAPHHIAHVAPQQCVPHYEMTYHNAE